MKDLILLVREKYGRKLFYPSCKTSETVTRLTGKKTITEQDIVLLREMGFEIDFRFPDPAIAGEHSTNQEGSES